MNKETCNGDCCRKRRELRNANYSRRVLRGLDNGFENADMMNAKFKYADLRGVDFSGADLMNADFRHADLEGAFFTGADLMNADFRGANLKNCNIEDAYCLKNTKYTKRYKRCFVCGKEK